MKDHSRLLIEFASVLAKKYFERRQFVIERIRQVVQKNFKEFCTPSHLFIGL